MEVSKVIGLATKALVLKDSEKFLKWLKIMPISQLKTEQSDRLLYHFLDTARQSQFLEIVPRIIFEWSASYPPSNSFPLLSYLFTQSIFTPDLLSFVIKAYPTITYLEIMLDFINYDSIPAISLACKKADQIFGTQSINTYKELYNKFQTDTLGLGNTKVNNRVEEYLEIKIKELSEYQEYPKWLISSDLTSSELMERLPKEMKTPAFTDQELLDLALENLNEVVNEEDREQAIEIMKKSFSIITREEKQKLWADLNKLQINNQEQEDVELFKILGPVNPILNATDEELKWGGERMFISSIYDYDEDIGEVEDYFTGNCQECNLKLRNRYHCVRLPRVTGGWLGCFCSWNCIRTFVKKNEEPNVLLEVMINIYQDQISAYGIYDRIDNLSFEKLFQN